MNAILYVAEYKIIKTYSLEDEGTLVLIFVLLCKQLEGIMLLTVGENRVCF